MVRMIIFVSGRSLKICSEAVIPATRVSIWISMRMMSGFSACAIFTASAPEAAMPTSSISLSCERMLEKYVRISGLSSAITIRIELKCLASSPVGAEYPPVYSAS